MTHKEDILDEFILSMVAPWLTERLPRPRALDGARRAEPRIPGRDTPQP